MTVSQTVRPNAIGSDLWTFTGGAGTVANLADNSDASYGVPATFYGGYIYFAPPTIPAGSTVKSITFRVRAALSTGTGTTAVDWFHPSNPSSPDGFTASQSTGETILSLSTTIKTYTVGVAGAQSYGVVVDAINGIGAAQKLGMKFTNTTNLRIYEAYVDVVFDEAPSATGLSISPAGAETRTTRPTFTWAYNDPEGSPQQAYWVEIWDTGDIAAEGALFQDTVLPNTTAHDGVFPYFGDLYRSGSSTSRPKAYTYNAPGSGQPNVDGPTNAYNGYFLGTAPVYGGATSWTPDKDLPNNRTYKAYVWVADDGAGIYTRFGDRSKAATLTFTVAVPLPPSPQSGGITAARVAAKYTNQISIQANNNVLTANQSDFGADTSGWESNSNATLSRNTTIGAFGSQCLDVTAVAAGGVGARTLQANGSRFNTPNSGSWTFRAAVRAAATARAAALVVRWFDSANTQVGSDVTVASATDSTSAWTTLAGTVSKPATAVTAVVVVSWAGAAAGEVHRIDTVGAFPGTVAAWSRGGLTAEQYALIERSTDGGATWSRIRLPYYSTIPDYGANALPLDAASQSAATYDPTLLPGQTARYRFATMSQDLGYLITSPVSASTVDIAGSVDAYLLRDPDDTSGAVVKVSVNGSLDSSNEERMGVFNPLGRANSVVLSDVVGGDAWQITTTTKTPTDYGELVALRAKRTVLLLQDDLGSQWWVRFGAQWQESLLQSTGRKTNQYRQISFGLVEQDPVGMPS